MKDVMTPYVVRLGKQHRDIIKKAAKKRKVKPSEFVRLALEAAAVR